MQKHASHDTALDRLTKQLDRQPIRAYGHAELLRLFSYERERLRLPSSTRIIDALQEMGLLLVQELKSESGYASLRRYVWREATPFEMAASIKARSYLSHTSAVFLHGLTDLSPQTQYVNAEQSPKPPPEGELTQASLDRAFRASQRQSRLVYVHGTSRTVVISGKSTGRYGVRPLPVAANRFVDATDLERTLVDLAVRPAYGGGVHQVLNVFRAAAEKVSVSKLVATLDALDYVYPYHQALGFYLERAGVPTRNLEPLRQRPMPLNFYLAHGLKGPTLDASWRIYVPKRL